MASRPIDPKPPEFSDDLPFYNGRPVEIKPSGWLLVVSAVIIGFLVLFLSGKMDVAGLLAIFPAFLFTALPLVGLAIAAGRHWTALFRPYGWKGFGTSILFCLATLALSGFIALALYPVAPMQANPAIEMLTQMTAGEVGIFLVQTFIQLVGEEVVTILPLLAVLWVAHGRFGLSRRAGLVLGVMFSTLWFASMHLPTYDWNLIQCFVVIGSSRLVLTAAYVLTRNLWVSTGAHILDDWSLFALSLAIPHLS